MSHFLIIGRLVKERQRIENPRDEKETTTRERDEFTGIYYEFENKPKKKAISRKDDASRRSKKHSWLRDFFI